MATWIKAGFWENLCKPCKGYKGWLNLDEFVKENSGGPAYKVYTALLNQSGTDDPVATVLENTFGGTPVWTRAGNGNYYCTLTGAFPQNKVFCSVTYGPTWGNGQLMINFGYNSNDDLYMNFFTLLGTSVDPNNNPGNDICVEIRVYP